MNLYEENIIDHYKNPRNKGTLPKASRQSKDSNPLCGDEIEYYLNVSNGKISAIKFNGTGCAISQAVASMLSEEMQGKKINAIADISEKDVFELLGTKPNPGRIKCALLPLNVLKAASKESN